MPATPTAQDLIEAYVNSTPLPAGLSESEATLERGHLRKAALEAIRGVQNEAEESQLHLHHAYRPEITAQMAVPLWDEANWDTIASWCGGTVKTAPDGTDSGEWHSWIALPNGETAFANMWIVKGLDGAFTTRHHVGDPDETTLRQIEAIGWEKGASTALSFATFNNDGTLALSVPNPGAAFLPTPDNPESGQGHQPAHEVRVILEPSDGLYADLACTGDADAPCRDQHGGCTLMEAFRADSTAALEGYQGTPLTLLAAPLDLVGLDEFEFTWKAKGIPAPAQA